MTQPNKRLKLLLGILFLASRAALGAEGSPARLSDQAIRALVSQLAHPQWRRREEAQEKLRQIGPRAVPFLEEAAHSTDQEQAFRARELLSALDPYEVVAAVVRISYPPDDPGSWRIERVNKFEGPSGRITIPDLEAYKVGVDPATGKFTFELVPLGALSTAACDLSAFEERKWVPVEERIELRFIENGVYTSAEKFESVLLVWAATGRRSKLRALSEPLAGVTDPQEQKRRLSEQLRMQLKGPCGAKLRLKTANLLARLREQGVREILREYAGDTDADCALALLGDREAEKRLESLLSAGLPTAAVQSAALTLAELANPSALDFLWDHLFEFTEIGRTRGALLLANQVEKLKGEETAERIKRFIKTAGGQPLLTWQSSLRYLLLTLAGSSEISPSSLRSSLCAVLRSSPTPGLTAKTETFLAALRVSLALHPASKEEALKLGEVCARHAVGSAWQETALLLPYLVRDGGSAAVAPLVQETCNALKAQPGSYTVRSMITALALTLPRESEEAKQLVELLGQRLNSIGRLRHSTTTISSSSLVAEPLALLLRIPYGGSATAQTLQRIRRVLNGQEPPGEPRTEALTLRIWHLERRGDEILERGSVQCVLRPLEPKLVKDDYGNLRIICLQPVRKSGAVLPTRRSTQSTYLYTPGRSRRYLRVGEPQLASSLFPDTEIRAYWQSSVYASERYRTLRNWRLHTVCKVKEGAYREPLRWSDFVRQAVEELNQLDLTSVRNRLSFFSELRIRQALPALHKVFKGRLDLETSVHFAHLGDPEGTKALLKALHTSRGLPRLRALGYLVELDPTAPEVLEALFDCLRQATRSELYQVASAARRILASPLAAEKRRKLLRALARKLSPQTASAIIPALRNATGLDFGYYQALTIRTSKERQQRIAAVVAAWRRSLLGRDTDKAEGGPASER